MASKRKIAAMLSATAIMTLIGAGGAQAQDRSGPEWGHCSDSGSAGNEFSHAKYIAAVCNGKLFSLTVNEATSPPTPVGGWRKVEGAPRHIDEVSVASNTRDVQGGPVFITVLTKRGHAYEGTCANTVPLGACTFRQLPKPPH